MFNWLRKYRRRKIVQTPFPAQWLSIIEEKVPHYKYLMDDEKDQLRLLTQIFISEKNFEGCNGLKITDEVKVVIAAQASLLVLSLPPYQYVQVKSVLVYPATIAISPPSQSVFTESMGIVPNRIAILGQASLNGPVILVWDAVKRGTRHPKSGHNVVYHEFAHILDLRDGTADGTPVITNRELFSDWVEICSREYMRLKTNTKRGRKTLLDRYGSVHEAEFFAVATELFFDRSIQMQREYPDLYNVMVEYYRQDTAEREKRYRKKKD
jgi:MtfA peptidase